MRITVTLDHALLLKAKEETGIEENSLIVVQRLLALIERENAHRLAQLGGTEKNLQPIPRRRSETL